MPPELQDCYDAALEKLRQLVLERLGRPLQDEEEARLLLGGLAVVSGFPKYGFAIRNLRKDGEICHECGARVPIHRYWPDMDEEEQPAMVSSAPRIRERQSAPTENYRMDGNR